MLIVRIVPAFLTALLPALAGPAAAQDCRLALILALDVSASVDRAEHQLQREGLARALVAPEVVQAFLRGDPVALHVFEWSEEHWQVPLVEGWQMVRSEEDLTRIAEVIAMRQRGLSDGIRWTAMGAALAHASDALSQAPECRAQTVDVSTDGWSNHGIEPGAVYATRPFDRVTVNALVVLGSDFDEEVVEWVEHRLLHGPAAFHLLADGYEDYQRAMTVKLRRELEMPMVGGDVVGASAG